MRIMAIDRPCKRCGHLQSDHTKKGKKPDHPGFRTLAKQGIAKANADFYETSELAFCNYPLCSCIDFV